MYSPQYIPYIFDKDFYNKYYGCNSSVQQFISDYIYQGRYIHRSIVEDNFDYALFISNLNWQNIHIDECCQAIMYFLDNYDKYKTWFVSSQPGSHLLKPSESTCIYYAHINSRFTLDIAKQSLNHLKTLLIEPHIIVSGSPKLIGQLSVDDLQYDKFFIHNIDSIDWGKIATHVDNFKQCFYINNKIFIYKPLENFCHTKNISSITDKYNTIFHTLDKDNYRFMNKFYYTINSNFFAFNHDIFRDILNILKTLYTNNENSLNYYITKYARQQDLDVNFYYRHNTNKEIFWHNLFQFNVCDSLILSQQNNIPVINIAEAKRLHNLFDDNKSNNYPTILPQTLCSSATTPATNKTDDSIACHIHIGNTNDRYVKDVYQTIDYLKQSGINIRFFLTSSEIIRNVPTIVVPNKGADIGPFLYILHNKILNHNFDFIIKLHTKTHHGFRKLAFDTLTQSLYNNIQILKDSNYSMLGVKDHEMMMDTINFSIMNDFCKKHNILYNHNISFYSGTMFIAKSQLFNDFANKYNINYMKEYYTLEDGFFQNHDASYTHSWERILSGIIPNVLNAKKVSV